MQLKKKKQPEATYEEPIYTPASDDDEPIDLDNDPQEAYADEELMDDEEQRSEEVIEDISEEVTEEPTQDVEPTPANVETTPIAPIMQAEPTTPPTIAEAMNQLRALLDLGIPINMIDRGNQYLILAQVPGATKEHIKLTYTHDTLTLCVTTATHAVEGTYCLHECVYGMHKREITLENAKFTDIAAKLTDGVLQLTVPKVAPAYTENIIPIE